MEKNPMEWQVLLETAGLSQFVLEVLECHQGLSKCDSCLSFALLLNGLLLIGSDIWMPTLSTMDRIRIIANGHFERDLN